MSALLVAIRSTAPNGKGEWNPVGRLEFEDDQYRFMYTVGARKSEHFKPFEGMDDISKKYVSDELFPIFSNRLMPKSRPEYEEFLRWTGFDPTNPPDPISVLGISEGIRQTDMVEVFPYPVMNGNGCYVQKFFLHGLRHMPDATKARVMALKEDEPLYLMADLFNLYHSQAIALRTEKDCTLLGYVPRYLAHDLWKLMEGCSPGLIEIQVQRVNRNAPLQQRLLCRMHACWPEGFHPFSEEAFQPIPELDREACPA